MKNKEKGYVILISVIVVGGVAVFISSYLLFSGISLSQESFVIEESAIARSFANSCAEEGLEKIREEKNFLGSQTLTFERGSCEYVVTSGGGEVRFINSTGISGDVLRRVSVELEEIDPVIKILSWEEVENF